MAGMHPLAADGAMVDRHVLIWRYRPDLWVSAFWGTPDEREAARVVEAYDVALKEQTRFRAFIDFSRIEHIEPAAFEKLAVWTRAARPSLEARLDWHVMVTPPGVLGAIVCGFHASLGYTMETRFFESVEGAVRTMFTSREASEFRRNVVARIDALAAPGLLARVRQAMREQPEATVDELARALGVSRRTLQRELGAAGTTFRAERIAERIALAKERLQHPEVKIEVIARELGFQSRQHFSRQFQRALGVSPSEFRESRRR